MVLRWLNRALCSGHDYSSWQGVDADPAFRRRVGNQSDSLPCHAFRKCSNCGDVDMKVEHHWGSPQTRSGHAHSSVDDYHGHAITSQVRPCLRSGCDATQRCG